MASYKLFFISAIIWFIPLTAMNIYWEYVKRDDLESFAKSGLIFSPLQIEAKEAIHSNFGQGITLPDEIRKQIEENYVSVMIGKGNDADLVYSFNKYLRNYFGFPLEPRNRLTFPQLYRLNWCQWNGFMVIARAARYRNDLELMECSEQEYNDVISIPEIPRCLILDRHVSSTNHLVKLTQQDPSIVKKKWEHRLSQEDDAQFGEQARRTATLIGIGTGLGCALTVGSLAYLSGVFKEESSVLPVTAIVGGSFTAGFFAGRSAVMKRMNAEKKHMNAEKRMRIDRKHEAMADFYNGKRSLYEPGQTVFE